MPRIFIKLILWLCDYIPFEYLNNYYCGRKCNFELHRHFKNEERMGKERVEIQKFLDCSGIRLPEMYDTMKFQVYSEGQKITRVLTLDELRDLS